MEKRIKFIFLVGICGFLISCGNGSTKEVRMPLSLYFHPEVTKKIVVVGDDQDVFSNKSWSVVIDDQMSFDLQWSTKESFFLNAYLPSSFRLESESNDEFLFKNDDEESLEIFLFDSISVQDERKHLLSEFKGLVDLCSLENNCITKKKVGNIFSYSGGYFISSLFHEKRKSKELLILSYLGFVNKEWIFCRYEVPYKEDLTLKHMLIFSSILNYMEIKNQTIVPMLDEVITSDPIIF